MTRRPHKKPRGALALIAGLLVLSAFIRIGLRAGEAIASQPESAAIHDPVTSAPLVCDTPEDYNTVIALMKTREERLDQTERDLEVRLKALNIAEQQIEDRIALLETTEQKLRQTIELAKGAAEEDVTRLTDVYARMKPKQAAALFEEMAPDFAAGFLARMPADAAAAIMAGMTPQSAYTLSVVLAGRNAKVPKE
ncbi:MAG: hypothetical protein MK160_00535 [Rhodobacteraceae bacterium]|nr:hypothetical protein [Paracoccaceae bacterium]